MRLRFVLRSILCLFAISPVSVYATPFTPQEWRQEVKTHPNQAHVGRLKHTTWVRDQNRNFIDDTIERRFGLFDKKISNGWHELAPEVKDSKVNIIVDFNSFMTIEEIRKKFQSPEQYYGDLKYICKTITSIFLDNVNVQHLPAIARMDEVALIEIQHAFQPALDISTRAIQAKATTLTTHPYYSKSASDAGLTGCGVTMAVIDTGVDDDQGQSGAHNQLVGKFVAGFDATKFEDTNNDGIDDNGDEPADGSTNPDDDFPGFRGRGHGTPVAGIALGQGVAGANCRTAQDSPNEPKDCSGVAPGAKLVDIKVCDPSNSEEPCSEEDVSEALDWLSLNYEKFDVRVANISLMIKSHQCDESNPDCGVIQKYDSDGTGLIPQQVNYLSALGIVMVAAYGNSKGLGISYGTRLTPSPGSASYAITVSATHDKKTINRHNDEIWRYGHLIGPRMDFDSHPDPLALKPDISAPGTYLVVPVKNSSDGYAESFGTSLATPHVAGAAALLLEKAPNMNPGDVKDILKRSADFDGFTPFNTGFDQNWNIKFGSGMLNVWEALQKLEPSTGASTDVGFPTCGGPPDRPGRPCVLSGGLPTWNNNQDISTKAPPQAGKANEIRVKIENSGSNPATFLVNFGVYLFAVGNNQFFHIGTTQASIDQGSTETVAHSWTPGYSGHQSVQVSIDYGLDTNFGNNITQRKLAVSPSLYEVRVENPFAVPAAFRVAPRSLRDGWDCRVNHGRFKLHPYLDPPQMVQIIFDPPKGAKPGEWADCDVDVYARQEGMEKEELIGGVTVQTFEPKPCRMIGWIKDQKGKPIPKAEIAIEDKRQQITAVSDQYGFVSFEGIPYRPQLITVVTDNYGKRTSQDRLYCGAGTFEILVSDEGLTIETQRRSTDWAWDLQLFEGYKAERKTN